MYGEALQVPDSLSRRIDGQREPTQRPSSQPAPVSRKSQQRRPANHVAQKPANPQVISSIIASLDSVSHPISHASYAVISSGDSQPEQPAIHSAPLSRASSRRISYIPAPRLRRSISLGMNHSAYVAARLEEEDDEDDDDRDDDGAAAFPVIRTSRRPLERSAHSQPLAASPSGSLREHLRSASRNSRSSLSLSGSDNGKNKLGRGNSRLSIESWSKRLSSSSQMSLESRPEGPARKPSSRQPSQETLRPTTIREERVAALITGPAPATPVKETKAISASPDKPQLARTSPRGRLYLDGTIEETIGAPQTVVKGKQKENADPSSPKRSSPKKSPIADAIPLRVSSLNHTPSPRQKKTKSSKSDKSRRTPTPSETDTGQPTSVASPVDSNHSVFEELDEENTTVKRIKELKRRREDRLKTESAAARSTDSTEMRLLPNSSTTSTDSNGRPAAGRSDSAKPPPKTADRTPDLAKAAKVLGLNTPSWPGEDLSDYRRYQRNQSASPELIKRRPHNTSTHDRNPSAQVQDPFDASPKLHQFPLPSNSRPAYALKDSKYDASVKRKSPAKSRLLHGLDLEDPDLTPPSTSHSSRSRRSRSNSNNLELWSSAGISNPAETSDKVRRKSMSDALGVRILEDEILEERRNSVNASVEEYLSAPRLNQKIRNPRDGRLVSFSEVGDPRGAAVIVCVGMGLTRFVTAFYDELATTLGLRLITLDRPGVGASEPYPERERVGPLSWPDDVVTVTQHLSISQFSVLAHSAGAIYALATALILPHCIKGKVQLLAPWIPPSQFDTFGIKDQSPDATPVGALPRSQRFLRVLPIPFLKVANGGLFSPSSLKPSSVRNSPTPSPAAGRDGQRDAKPKRRPEPLRRESMILMDHVVPEKPVATMFPISDLLDEDLSGLQPLRKPSLVLTATATPTDPDLTFVAEALDAAEHSARERQSAYSALLTERTWTLATRNSNPAVDLLVCLERNRDIGFRYVDIQRQIVITHGSEDKRVPVENIRWIGEQINRRAAKNWNPDAKQDFRERGGCEVRVLPGEGHGLMASPGVMADVLSEIGREWIRRKW